MSDNKPTSLEDILEAFEFDIQTAESSNERMTARSTALAAIAAYYEGLIPEKRKLYEPVTKREVKEGGKAMIDLVMDKQGSLVFIQDNGFNQAIDTIHRNFTGQTDTERKQ